MIFLTIAGIVSAIGVTMFLEPVKLYDCGISGTSMLLSHITPQHLSLSIFLVVLNIPLLLFGLKKEGKLFTFYSVYAIAVFSLSAWLITNVLPIDVSMISPLAGTDLLLCSLFGGLVCGTGSGIAIRFGGVIDGIEVMAVIFAKRLSLSVGTFVMIYNVMLYIFCGFFLGSWILPLYSIVAYCVALKAVDFIVEGIDRSKAATIITQNPDAVASAISETFECGITVMQAKGFYSSEAKTMLYVVLNRFQIPRCKDIVHECDPTAYISITEVADVFPAKIKKPPQKEKPQETPEEAKTQIVNE